MTNYATYFVAKTNQTNRKKAVSGKDGSTELKASACAACAICECAHIRTSSTPLYPHSVFYLKSQKNSIFVSYYLCFLYILFVLLYNEQQNKASCYLLCSESNSK
jgi:hypothetical protein